MTDYKRRASAPEGCFSAIRTFTTGGQVRTIASAPARTNSRSGRKTPPSPGRRTGTSCPRGREATRAGCATRWGQIRPPAEERTRPSLPAKECRPPGEKGAKIRPGQPQCPGWSCRPAAPPLARALRRRQRLQGLTLGRRRRGLPSAGPQSSRQPAARCPGRVLWSEVSFRYDGSSDGCRPAFLTPSRRFAVAPGERRQ
jgi:hypothetical protein